MHSPDNSLERICAYGPFDSGKSVMWADLAKWIALTGSPSHIYAADTDNTWDRQGNPAWTSFTHVTRLTRGEYPAWCAWAAESAKAAKPGDWIVVDMADKVYEEVQSYYWSKNGFDSLADVYTLDLQNREKKGKGVFHMAGDHGANWGPIYKYYADFWNPLMSANCHVLIVAHAKPHTRDTPEAVVKKWPVGWKPAGPGSAEKELSNPFHTILFTEKMGEDYFYTTIRDKAAWGEPGRRKIRTEKVEGFVMNYLVGVAGWGL